MPIGPLRDDDPAAAPPRRHRLRFAALAREVDAREDESVLAAARRAGVRIVGACGGRGHCGSCVVRVLDGRVHRDGEGAHRQWLRACRVQPRSDLLLELAPRSLAPIVRAEVQADLRRGGDDAVLPLQPLVSAHELQLPPASLAAPCSDLERGRRAWPPTHAASAAGAASAAAVAALPALLRRHGGHVQARCAHAAGAPPRLLGFARPGAPLLGLAVDLGTTNAAAFLVDLASGRRLASLGLENPQVAWGADLVSRIDHAMQSPAAAGALRDAARAVIDALAQELTRAVDAQPQDIADLVVCGNTAMQHLLAGWPVAQLGRAPFVAASTEAADIGAAELGLQVAPAAGVHLAPGVGGFIGGDHVAALLATEPLWQQAGSTLLMDIGTNTEISLLRHAGGGTRIWSASCPSGPALEGGHIASGMRAAAGAIEHVRIAHGRLQLQVIGGGRPVGLCGSGVLDALAAFVHAGWIDARGRVAAAHADLHEGVRAITLAAQTPRVPAVRFTQHDVRAVQLAKSAIRTGVRLLAAEAGIDEAGLNRFVIAGAFGAHIGIEACVAIGLLPALPRERFVQVGNAAGLGVQQMLASLPRRARAAELARRCRYVELSARADFQKTFLHHIGFAA